MSNYLNNYHQIKTQIANFETKYHRQSGSVKLIAVAKSQPLSALQKIIDAGQIAFAENYLNEALTHQKGLNEASLEWHFIGAVQSNKIRKLAENFSWVLCVVSRAVADRLNELRPTHLPKLNICLQININQEKKKGGVKIQDTLPLAKHCANLPNLNLRGLMIIPQITNDFETQRSVFKQLGAIKADLSDHDIVLDSLSMGMSNDMEAAIAEGATHIRIGRGIFGER